ncbi:MAG: hypothetical protein HY268_07620, partial [Deltaproteobacteria bacterium]|nr:hypothetical protein [Deltaproteobacteria bacterium]
MEEYANPQKAKHGLLVSALVLNVLFAVGIQPAIPAEVQQKNAVETPASPNTTTTVGEKQGKKTAYSPEGAAGMRVYVDPNTGEILKPPVGAPAETPESLEKAFSTSSESLVETPSPVPGGGVILDLQGRFRSPLVATQGADGKISIEHLPVTPGS